MKIRHPHRWVIFTLLLGALAIIPLRPLDRLQFEVTSLLPADERDPAVQLVRSFATQAQSRTVLLVAEGVPDAAAAQAVNRIMRAQLAEDPAVAEIWGLDPAQLDESALDSWKVHAVEWFWPQWWDSAGRPTDLEAIANRALDELETFLQRPESFAWEDSVTTDPFLLVPHSLGRLGSVFSIDTGDHEAGRLRWWIKMSGDPFDASARQKLFHALDRAADAVREEIPEVSLQSTGVAQLADASETGIRAEIYRLNWLVGISALLICALFLRRLGLFGPLLLILLASLTGGTLLVFLLNAHLHVITLVVGSILIGVAIDYGLHVFLEAKAASPVERWKRVRRPLLVGSLSTIGGFAVLLLTELPFLRQLGSFMAGGLLAALGASLFYARFGTIRETPVYLLPKLRWVEFPFLRTILLVVAGLLVCGIARIEWNDDIREFNLAVPSADARDAAVRAAFGEDKGTHSLLLGESWQALHDSLEEIARRDLEIPVSSLGVWATAPRLMVEAHAAMRDQPFASAFEQALAARGFEAEAFAPFFEQWKAWIETPLSRTQAEQIASAQFASLPGPVALLAGESGDLHWWLLDSPQPLEAESMADLSARWLPLAQLQSLNDALTRYREQMVRASFYGLSALAIGLLLGYGVRRGLILLLLPALPTAMSLGYFGWRDAPLTLFHLLGAFLSVCLTLDYIVFATSARTENRPLPVSISLSAFTTGVSFAWLATSHIPAISALGATVAMSVAFAWLLALALTGASSLPIKQSLR